jgi:hypothetical protein
VAWSTAITKPSIRMRLVIVALVMVVALRLCRHCGAGVACPSTRGGAMAQPVAAGGRRRRPLTLVALIAATAVYVLSLPFAVVAALMSPMAFDSGQSPAAWAYLGGALSYPIWVVAGLVSAWLFYRRRRERASMVALLLPLLGSPLVAVAAALLLGR